MLAQLIGKAQAIGQKQNFLFVLLMFLIESIHGEQQVIQQIRRLSGYSLVFNSVTQNIRALDSAQCIGTCVATPTCSAVTYDRSNLFCSMGFGSAFEILEAASDFEAVIINSVY